MFFQNAFSQCTSRASVADQRIITPTAANFGISYGMGAPAFAYGGQSAPLAYDGLNAWAGRGTAYDGLYPTMAPAMDFTPTRGGGLPVTSASAVPPTGISVVSENAFEGLLSAAGELPFVGTTTMEGVLPSAGAGAINHACGNGVNAMVSETSAFVPEVAAATFAPGAAAFTPAAYAAPGLGYRAGWGA